MGHRRLGRVGIIAEEALREPVWLITMTAVYDHGCAGIFTSREAAVAHAQHLQCTSDGHHTFRVEPFRLNDPIDIVGRGSAERGGRRHHKGGTVVVVEEPDAG